MKSKWALIFVSLLMTASFANAQNQEGGEVAPATTPGEPTAAEETQPTKTEFGELSGTQKYKITCTAGQDVREITVITQPDNSVGVAYKKFNETKTLAVAKADPSYADQVAEKIKGNLSAAGFSCSQDAQSAGAQPTAADPTPAPQ